MDIKKHYKIFISIIIIVILISSFIIYDITSKKNIDYNDNVDKINLKYFNNLGEWEYSLHNLRNYTISSNYIINNKISYLNSTIVEPYIFSGGSHTYCIGFGINIHLKNINNKYIYLIIKNKDGFPKTIFIHNAKTIKTAYNNNLCTYKFKIINDNKNITVNYTSIPFCNDSNISIKISLNNNFYNLFDVNTMKEAAIYGKVLTGNVSSIFIENLNIDNYHIVKVVNGYFYFFAKPYAEYGIYYLHNNSLNKFYYIHNGNMSKLNYLNTTSAGTSRNIDLYTSLLT